MQVKNSAYGIECFAILKYQHFVSSTHYVMHE